MGEYPNLQTLYRSFSENKILQFILSLDYYLVEVASY